MKKISLYALIVVCMLTLFFSCEKEEIQLLEDTTAQQDESNLPETVLKIKNNFSLENFKDSLGVVKENIEIEWANYKAKKRDGVKWYDFSVNTLASGSLDSDLREKPWFRLLARLENKKVTNLFLVKMTPTKQENNSLKRGSSYINIEDYSGTVYVYDMLGTTVLLEYYKDGAIASSVADVSVEDISVLPYSRKVGCMKVGTAQPKCSDALSCAFEFYNHAQCGTAGYYGEGRWMPVVTYHYTDWYKVYDNTREYTSTRYNGSTTEYVWVEASSPIYDTNNTLHEGSFENRDTDTERPISNPMPTREDRILDLLEGKEKCLNDALTNNGNNFVKKLLSNFKGDSEFNITIKSKDRVISSRTGREVNGNCSPPKNGIITININKGKSNSNPALEVARTILHEYIHADIFRKLKSKTPTSEDLDFRDTYKRYEEQFSNEIQHEAMADLYINSMKNALKNFHKNVLTDDYNKFVNYYEETPSDTFYEALAWRGLRNHDVKAYTDLSDERKAELETEDYKIGLLTKDCPNSN